jgi:CDP-diacylglycerol--serine O-phosphatidyltransferase
MNRLRITPSVIPNMFTAMNMFSGFLSVIYTSQARYYDAAWLTIVGALFDALDGFMARLTHSSSELGVELDSLSDIISFGAAPAFLIYSVYLHQFNTIGILISSLLLLAGGFRLARFNVQLVGFDKAFFKGLPIPSSGIMMATFILAFYKPGSGFPERLQAFVIPLVLMLSYLMVSNIKYDTLPQFTLKGLIEKPLYLFIIPVVIVLLIFTPPAAALFYTFVFFIVFGIFRTILNFVFKQKKHKTG